MGIDGALGLQRPPFMPRRIEAVDVLVGQRIRALRLRQGMSQSALGEKVGVTFQQIQKYEKGVNRVGGSRLKKVATVLGVRIAALFPGEEGGKDELLPDALIEMLGQRHAARLLTAFYAIGSAKERLALVKLAEKIAESGE
jgi:transcriptional regulator with XRE-family HTH domain